MTVMLDAQSEQGTTRINFVNCDLSCNVVPWSHRFFLTFFLLLIFLRMRELRENHEGRKTSGTRVVMMPISMTSCLCRTLL